MQIKKTLYIIAFFTLIYSCKNEKTYHIHENIKVDVTKDAKKISLKTLSDSLLIIPLETSKSSYIKKIREICIDDSIIFIFDQENQSIHKFNFDGKHIGKIGNRGKSGKEYIFLNDIYIDTSENIIYAHDRHKKQIFCYEYSGKLKEQIRCKYDFNSFTKYKSDFWIYSCFTTKEGERYNLMCLDNKLKTVKYQFLPQQNEFIGATFNDTFTRDTKGNAYFYYPMSDGLYKLKTDDIELRYNFDFGDRKKPYELLQKTNSHKKHDEILTSNNYLGSLSDVHFYKNYLFARFRESPIGVPKRSYSFCYNITNKEGYPITFLRDTPLNCYNILGSWNDYLISYLDPYQIYGDEGKLLEEQYNLYGITKTSNPILVLYKIKDKIL